MAGSFSDFWEDEIIDHVFKTGAYTAPGNIYLALSLSTITDASTGSIPGEVSGGAYARLVCNTWDASSGGATANAKTKTFTQATADWGVIEYFALIDSDVGGNLLAYGDLTVSKNVQSGDTASFASGDIDVTLT